MGRPVPESGWTRIAGYARRTGERRDRACAARLDAISEARRALEARRLERTPEYRQIATERDRANEALHAARKLAGDSSPKVTADMVYVGHTDATEEEMLEFIESRARALKRMREIVGGAARGVSEAQLRSRDRY